MLTLNSTEEVIEALGGMATVAALTGRTNSPSVVWNWKDRKRFPATTYTIMQEALKERGISAPNSLWGMP